MLTKKDLENIRDIIYHHGEMLKAELKTELKVELRKDMKEEISQLRNEMNNKFDHIQGEIVQFKEEFVQFTDQTLGKFKDIQEDIAILSGHQDIWERHESDIQRLKKKIFPDMINDSNK